MLLKPKKKKKMPLSNPNDILLSHLINDKIPNKHNQLKDNKPAL